MKFRDLFHAEINVIEPFLEALINEFRFSPDFKYGPYYMAEMEMSVGKFRFIKVHVSYYQRAVGNGYIDVGDGCWRRNVLATTSR